MRKTMSCGLLLLIVALLSGVLRADGPLPSAISDRMLIISVDGLRPDLLTRASTPNIHAMMEHGAYTLWARTTQVAITLPSHVSMLTGVTPDRHHVNWNNEANAPADARPAVPTILELAHAAGLHVAMSAGKLKFNIFASPGTLVADFTPKTSKCTDDDVADHAVKIIVENKPNLMLVHFPGGDSSGHSKGWGTPEQIKALEQIDRGIGRVMEAYRQIGWSDSMYTILSADHGGAGVGHGANDDRSKYIPWILTGPKARVDYDLTRYPKLDIRTEDTFATACKILGIKWPAPPDGKPIDGRPVDEAFVQTELLQSK